MKKLADGRLCSPGPMQYAITAALTGDRSHQRDVRRRASRARRSDDDAAARDAGHDAAWRRRAAFYAMPQVALPPGKTDEDYVLGLLRAKGILCVYGSGFGSRADRRLLPHRLSRARRTSCRRIYDDMAAFTAEFVSLTPRPWLNALSRTTRTILTAVA